MSKTRMWPKSEKSLKNILEFWLTVICLGSIMWISRAVRDRRGGERGLVGPRPHYFFARPPPLFALKRKIIKIQKRHLLDGMKIVWRISVSFLMPTYKEQQILDKVCKLSHATAKSNRILFLFPIFNMKKLFSIVSPPTFHLAPQSLMSNSKLKYFVPMHTLLTIYRSLIAPFLTCGLVAWGQACKSSVDKPPKLQKRALRSIYSVWPQWPCYPSLSWCRYTTTNIFLLWINS